MSLPKWATVERAHKLKLIVTCACLVTIISLSSGLLYFWYESNYATEFTIGTWTIDENTKNFTIHGLHSDLEVKRLSSGVFLFTFTRDYYVTAQSCREVTNTSYGVKPYTTLWVTSSPSFSSTPVLRMCDTLQLTLTDYKSAQVTVTEHYYR